MTPGLYEEKEGKKEALMQQRLKEGSLVRPKSRDAAR